MTILSPKNWEIMGQIDQNVYVGPPPAPLPCNPIKISSMKVLSGDSAQFRYGNRNVILVNIPEQRLSAKMARGIAEWLLLAADEIELVQTDALSKY